MNLYGVRSVHKGVLYMYSYHSFGYELSSFGRFHAETKNNPQEHRQRLVVSHVVWNSAMNTIVWCKFFAKHVRCENYKKVCVLVIFNKTNERVCGKASSCCFLLLRTFRIDPRNRFPKRTARPESKQKTAKVYHSQESNPQRTPKHDMMVWRVV